MGNVIIKEVLKSRREELLKSKEIRHAKARQKLRQDSLLYLLERSAQIAAIADMEALGCFKEFLEKLELAQIERQLEQAEM